MHTEVADRLQKFLLTSIPTAYWNTFRDFELQKAPMLANFTSKRLRCSRISLVKSLYVALWLFLNTFRDSALFANNILFGVDQRPLYLLFFNFCPCRCHPVFRPKEERSIVLQSIIRKV